MSYFRSLGFGRCHRIRWWTQHVCGCGSIDDLEHAERVSEMNGHVKRIIQWSIGTINICDKILKRTVLEANKIYEYSKDNELIKAIAAPSTTAHGPQQADIMVEKSSAVSGRNCPSPSESSHW